MKCRATATRRQFCLADFIFDVAQSLDWSGLQLGDNKAGRLVQTLVAGEAASAVTSLDLRNNNLSTLPLELHRLEQLTELQFEEGNPGLDPALGKVRLPAYALSQCSTEG